MREAAGVLLVGLSTLSITRADAAGLLVADGGFGGALEVKEQDVKVTVNNGIAVTTVIQVFHNTEKREVEALYSFPVPKGASVANFSMWIGGKEMVGEVLEKKHAREIYDSYKQVRRDPGLLEQKDFKSFEMRIYPIPSQADQKVQICYYQELDYDHDWATYVYPLATTTKDRPDQRTTGRFSVSIDIKSAVPIAAVESPSHSDGFVVARHSDTYAQASLEMTEGSLARDIVLSHQISRPKTGIDLLASARPSEDGFFSLTFSAGEDLAQSDAGSDYVFLLDVSGSMSNDGKLLLSKDCLGAFIGELAEKDRLEVITFNLQPILAFNDKLPANASTKELALQFLAGAKANGGTVLNPALTTAYKYSDPDRPLNIVILSDGLTEQRDRATLLQLIQQRPRNAKVFCVGVGNDVNKPLLEQLAEDSGGLASFLSHGDDFRRQAKAFRRKLMNPVATDVKIDFGGIDVSDVEPKQIPNLYHGAPVRLYGRYHGAGKGSVKLRANLNGVAWEQSAELDFPKSDKTNPEIDRMWAWKRIDSLLKNADRGGSRDGVIPEVVRLGEQFSIVTEYTSFLVLENDAEYQRWKIARRNVERTARDRQSQTTRENQLASIRERALKNLGPQPTAQTKAERSQLASAQPIPANNVPVPAPASAPAPTYSAQSRDFSIPTWSGRSSGGSGPVGPLFVAFSAYLARRLKHGGAPPA